MTATSEALSDVNGYGTLAARPAAGIAGRLYFASDTGQVFRDNGSTWVTVLGVGGVIPAGPPGPPGPAGEDGEPGPPGPSGTGSGGGAALTVEEVDGSPTDAAITKIVFPNDSVSIASHVATIRQVPYGAIGARAYNSVVQNLASTAEVALTLNAESWDTDGFHSTSVNTSRMTIPAGLGGKYLVNAGTYVPTTSATITFYLEVRVNGTEIWREAWSGNGTFAADARGISRLLDLVAGDYVEIYGYNGAPGSVDFGHGSAAYVQTFLEIHKLDSGKVGAGIGAKNSSGSVTLVNGSNVSLAFASADDYDTDNYHDTVTNNTRFTVPAGLGGLHLVEINASTSSGASQDRRVGYRVNGGSDIILHREYYSNPGVAMFYSGGVILNLAAGDYVEARILVDAGAGTGSGTLSIARLDSGNPRMPMSDAATASVATDQTTTSTSYTDLTTTGPAVTVTVNTKVLVTVTCRRYGSASQYAVMGVALAGANTVAASDAQATSDGEAAFDSTGSTTSVLTGLTPGSTVFTAKYKSLNSGTVHFLNRTISVVPLD